MCLAGILAISYIFLVSEQRGTRATAMPWGFTQELIGLEGRISGLPVNGCLVGARLASLYGLNLDYHDERLSNVTEQHFLTTADALVSTLKLMARDADDSGAVDSIQRARAGWKHACSYNMTGAFGDLRRPPSYDASAQPFLDWFVGPARSSWCFGDTKDYPLSGELEGARSRCMDFISRRFERNGEVQLRVGGLVVRWELFFTCERTKERNPAEKSGFKALRSIARKLKLRALCKDVRLPDARRRVMDSWWKWMMQAPLPPKAAAPAPSAGGLVLPGQGLPAQVPPNAPAAPVLVAAGKKPAVPRILLSRKEWATHIGKSSGGLTNIILAKKVQVPWLRGSEITDQDKRTQNDRAKQRICIEEAQKLSLGFDYVWLDSPERCNCPACKRR
jgi:hypothetical protein